MQFYIPCFHILNQTGFYCNMLSYFINFYVCAIKCYYKYVVTINNIVEGTDRQIRAQFNDIYLLENQFQCINFACKYKSGAKDKNTRNIKKI